MPSPGVDQLSERALDVLARQQVDVAARALTTKAKAAGPGVAMLGGAGFLAVLASGSGTAALVLLLARRPGAPAALGVTGAYAGASAFLAREGLTRLREAGWLVSDTAGQKANAEDVSDDARHKARADDVIEKARPKKAVRNVKQTAGSAKRRGKSAPQLAGRAGPRSRVTGSQPAGSRKQSGRANQRPSRRT